MVPIAHKRFQAETPDWSPDSIWLAFIEGDERLGPDKINLLAVKTDGSDLHTVISCGEQGCRNARWSNDGQRIAFGSSQGLEVVSADGRTREVVYKSKARGVFNLDWSPTSSQIALLESSPFPLPVVTLVDLFDKSAREIRLPVIPREVVWSPTGEQLAIRGSTPDWEEDRLVIIDQQGNELMNIKLDLNAAGLDWGP
jgi:dipeptidyl aminopeptidase/acylaminoacyl peptidase